MSMKEPSNVSEAFLNQIRIAWQNKMNRRMGITHAVDHEIKDEDMGKFWQARHIKK